MTGSDAANNGARTALIVASSLLLFPAAFLGWIWVARSGGDLVTATRLTLEAADDDPLLLWAAIDLALLSLTCTAWVWRDAGRRGAGAGARLLWTAATLVLGVLGLWLYLARRSA